MDRNLVVRSQRWESERREANISWVIQPALRSRKSARNRERERKKDKGTKALMKQKCFIQHGVGIYTVLQSSYSQLKMKLPDLQNIGDPY